MKLLRICLLVLFAFGVGQEVDAQYFNNLYYDGYPTMMFGSIKQYNSNYYVTGVSLSKVAPSSYERALFGKIDNNGNIDSIYSYFNGDTIDYALFLNALKKTADGNFVTTGYYTDSVDHAFLMKVDTAGNILLWHSYSDSLIQIFVGTDIIELPGQGYLLTVDDVHTDNTVKTLVIRTDTIGNILAQHLFYTNNWADPWTIRKMSNGHFMIGAQNQKTTFFSPYWTQTWLIEVDSMGDMVRQWFDSDLTNSGPRGMLQTPDSGWIIARAHLAYDSFNNQAYNCSIIRLDKNFNKLWEIDTGAADTNCGMYDLQMLSDGSFVCVGAFSVQTTADSSHTFGIIMKISAIGQLLWQRLYLGYDTIESYSYLYSTNIMPNGDILSCGENDFYQNVGITPIQQGWILRTDSNGCLIDNCWVTDIATMNNNQLTVEIFPNPAKNNFTLKLSLPPAEDVYLNVYDITGRLSLHQLLTQQTTTIPNQLSTGMYLWQVNSIGGGVGGGKLVVE